MSCVWIGQGVSVPCWDTVNDIYIPQLGYTVYVIEIPQKHTIHKA